jgi:hypothetical protein
LIGDGLIDEHYKISFYGVDFNIYNLMIYVCLDIYGDAVKKINPNNKKNKENQVRNKEVSHLVYRNLDIILAEYGGIIHLILAVGLIVFDSDMKEFARRSLLSGLHPC